MNNKDKCKLLKQIRKEIAESNGIVYLTSECTIEGECNGTCPICEAEIRYLDNEIASKISKGETITLSDLSLNSLNDDLIMMKKSNRESGTKIDDADLSVRDYNFLKNTGIQTIEEFKQLSDDEKKRLTSFYLRKRGGPKEVKDKIYDLGLTFKSYE